MANGYIEKKGAIKTFLIELNRILNNNISSLIIEPREDKEEKFTTRYCLSELGYDQNDVKNELKKLTVKEYVETCDDNKNLKTNKYYIFDKFIDNNEIYIKIKIKSYTNYEVLCMSFHFAEYHITKFPYK